MTRNMMLKDLRQVGNEGAHLKLKLSDGHGEVDVIGFRLGSMAKGLKLNNPYNILYNLETNEWNGMESAQLNLIDIR
jgi:single-stranded-DNA-specific exonuclease